MSSVILRLTCAKYGVFCNRFSNVFSDVIQSFLSGLRDGWRRDARRRLPTSCPLASLRPFELYVIPYFSIATLDVGFPASCPMASPGSRLLIMASFGGVAMLDVVFRALFPMNPEAHQREMWHLVEGLR
jgi:hypothetical protein